MQSVSLQRRKDIQIYLGQWGTKAILTVLVRDDATLKVLAERHASLMKAEVRSILKPPGTLWPGQPQNQACPWGK